MKRLLAAAAIAVLLVTGCGGRSDDATATGPGGTNPESTATGAESVLAKYHLNGMTTAQIIDRLDRLPIGERPIDLTASVRPNALMISSGPRQFELDLRQDLFYLSVAPYLNRTHDCFYHSLTTCVGELAGTDVIVKIVDGTDGRVLVDDKRTTFANGFVGFWLPRDIEATLRMTYGGKVGETTVRTDADAPTCLTTLRLS
jgi:hypothetical protein